MIIQVHPLPKVWVEDILDVIQLEKFPRLGAIETNLSRLEGEYRYLEGGIVNIKLYIGLKGMLFTL
ncbi:hypothetical protein [Dysgonomonas sp. 521]|uniref:hypothetical protein n=1 Tax=Dysgonomonas sp. 521 TaxID=2302932 RepID=UPI0013D6A39D|nr:hypothetical protein [Dysgonomonas sp. 521]